MLVNLSYNTLCVLRDCVDKALRTATVYDERVLKLSTEDNGNELETISECLSMLKEFVSEAQ